MEEQEAGAGAGGRTEGAIKCGAETHIDYTVYLRAGSILGFPKSPQPKEPKPA